MLVHRYSISFPFPFSLLSPLSPSLLPFLLFLLSLLTFLLSFLSSFAPSSSSSFLPPFSPSSPPPPSPYNTLFYLVLLTSLIQNEDAVKRAQNHKKACYEKNNRVRLMYKYFFITACRACIRCLLNS